ncbi:hypothetical protein ACQUW5_10865 [Legionella sp. CNM-1927-20]|uniref:hypothetical protein n=1 Tax=Legionella sp. CNM-1927-20 TaxID=3422221 RepID=UPI00403AECF6
MPSNNKTESQNIYYQDIISALFTAASNRDNKMIETLLKIKDVSLNIVNETGKSLIATWCECNREHSSDLKKMEEWIDSGQVDLTFEFQSIDIIKWCLKKAISNKDIDSLQKPYLTLVQKIIQFLPLDKELLERYSTLLPDTVQNTCTLSITKTLVSLSGINMQAKGSNSKDVFQTALENRNIEAINLLIEVLELSKHKSSHITSKPSLNHSTLEKLKITISKCFNLLFNSEDTELEELLVQVGIQTLHLCEESGRYPNNFADLLFELSNKLSSMNEGQAEDAAYSLRKFAADLGHTRAQEIIKNFSNRAKSTENLIIQSEPPKEVEIVSSAPLFQEKSSHKFFQRFKLKLKEKHLDNSKAPNISQT